MPKVTEAIESFLTARKSSHNGPDLLERYLQFAPYMETQVNVAAGKGWPVDGKRSTYTDGIDEWFNIRIPKKANSDPTFHDYDLQFVLDEHADAIGSTGWDWAAKRSRWLCFDFDSITGHAAGVGISDAELEKVKQAACAIPWVEVRRSTGGNGLHLYVIFDDAGIPTENHTIHAALGRTILGLMSSETGFDFARQVDACGSVVWLWARKMTPENQGLALLKPAAQTFAGTDLPANWRDHVEVVTRQRSKVKIDGVPDEHRDSWEALASSRRNIPLDEKHKKSIDELRRMGGSVVWVPDYHLLQTHTCMLQRLLDEKREELGLVGFFKTNSAGKDLGGANCFLFPLDQGGWKVYRFSPGIAEAETWEQDGQGWTTCYFNRAPSLKVASRAMGGVEDAEKGGFVFETANRAKEAALALGRELPIPDELRDREVRLKAHKDGRLVAQVAKAEGDEGMRRLGWQAKKGYWLQIFETRTEVRAENATSYDHPKVRRLVGPSGEAAGWMIAGIRGDWFRCAKDDAKSVLLADGLVKPEADATLGRLLQAPWKLVNIPFGSSYPGDRQVNLWAAQFAFIPADVDDDELHHPTWDLILSHLGTCLDAAIATNPWCIEHGVKTGRHWLLLWIASVVQDPYCKLPFIFAWGPEDSGKTIFWEALALLLTGGVVEANRALLDDTGFNSELADAVIAYIEEADLTRGKHAKTRLRQWVTDYRLTIRKMRTDAYSQKSTLHWYMSANSPHHLSFLPGDSRITVLTVTKPQNPIDKEELFRLLRDEASHFLATLIRTPLPPPAGRLRIPMIATEEKEAISDVANPLSVWFRERTNVQPNVAIIKADLYADYRLWAEEQDVHPLAQEAFGRQLRELTGGVIKASKLKDCDGRRRDSYVGIELRTERQQAA